VYTRKLHTDVCYLAACRAQAARRTRRGVSAVRDPQRATLATIIQMEGPIFTSGSTNSSACTAWANHSTSAWSASESRSTLPHLCPVGTHETLLGYLVRRLLETAPTLLRHRIADPEVSIDELIAIRSQPAAGCHPAARRTRGSAAIVRCSARSA